MLRVQTVLLALVGALLMAGCVGANEGPEPGAYLRIEMPGSPVIEYKSREGDVIEGIDVISGQSRRFSLKFIRYVVVDASEVELMRARRAKEPDKSDIERQMDSLQGELKGAQNTMGTLMDMPPGALPP